MTTNNYFGTTSNLADGQPDQINSNITNFVNILYGAAWGRQESIPQSPQVVKALSDFINNRTQDVETFLSVTFPLEWIKEHPDYLETIPKTPEIVPPTTLVQQFNVVENWLDTNWSGVCSQLSNISNLL